MKGIRKIIVILTLCMIGSAGSEVMAADHGISDPRRTGTIRDFTTVWDCIWFGNYYQSNNITKEPIKWRVLDVDGDKAFLLSDKIIDCQQYHDISLKSVTWETCSLRTWINSVFYNTAFSSAEQKAILTTTVKNPRNTMYSRGGGNDTQDKVLLLSINEAGTKEYGFEPVHKNTTATRESLVTPYAKSKGAEESTDESFAGYGYWALRSCGQYNHYYAFVGDNGWLLDDGTMNTVKSGIRPAIWIDLTSNLWSRAGTVCSDGNISEIVPSPNASTRNDASESSPSIKPSLGTLTSKKANTLTVKAKTVSVKAAKVKKKSIVVNTKKVFVLGGAKGKISFKKNGGSNKLKINKKTGKITIKKGTKKGTYKIYVTVKATGNSEYVEGSQTVVVKVKVR